MNRPKNAAITATGVQLDPLGAHRDRRGPPPRAARRAPDLELIGGATAAIGENRTTSTAAEPPTTATAAELGTATTASSASTPRPRA